MVESEITEDKGIVNVNVLGIGSYTSERSFFPSFVIEQMESDTESPANAALSRRNYV